MSNKTRFLPIIYRPFMTPLSYRASQSSANKHWELNQNCQSTNCLERFCGELVGHE